MAKKKKKTETEGPPDIGMVMTVSLFLILLTFFILLNSIAVIDESRTLAAIGSLIGAFGALPGGMSPLADGESILPPTAPLAEEELTVEQILAVMTKSRAAMVGEIKVTEIKGGELITISEKALFADNNLKINVSIQPFLNKLGSFINRADYAVEIIGHTDTGSSQEKGYRSNWVLSALMALEVLKYFVSNSQIAAERLTAYGYGGRRPVASNETVHSRAGNRRVEIVLKYRAPAHVKRIFKKKSSSYFTYKKFDFKIF